MRFYEINTILQYSTYKHKEGWEQSRLVAFITAQCNSAKNIKPSDIIKFPWDKASADENPNTRILNEDIERLKKKSELFIKSKQNG